MIVGRLLAFHARQSIVRNFGASTKLEQLHQQNSNKSPKILITGKSICNHSSAAIEESYMRKIYEQSDFPQVDWVSLEPSVQNFCAANTEMRM